MIFIEKIKSGLLYNLLSKSMGVSFDGIKKKILI